MGDSAAAGGAKANLTERLARTASRHPGRTFGAWLAASGESLPLIGQALNLSTPLSPARFADLHLDPIREALERNVKRMLLGKGKIGPAFPKGAVPTTTVQNPLMALTSPEQKEKTQ